MQSYTVAIVVLALLGLVAAENHLPKSPSQIEHDNLVEKLYDPEGNTDPENTKNILVQLVEHYSTYDQDLDSPSDEEKKERTLIALLASLDNLAVYRCNKKFFGGIHSLVNSFIYTNPSPVLHNYVSNIRDRQADFCVVFYDSKFSTYANDLDVALELLA